MITDRPALPLDDVLPIEEFLTVVRTGVEHESDLSTSYKFKKA